MKSDTLRLMALGLTEMVRKMPKLDWTERESVRASLRRNVRRLLAKYGYPPDLAEDATQLVCDAGHKRNTSRVQASVAANGPCTLLKQPCPSTTRSSSVRTQSTKTHES